MSTLARAGPASRSSQRARSSARVPNLALAPDDVPGALQRRVRLLCPGGVAPARCARDRRHRGRARDRRAERGSRCCRRRPPCRRTPIATSGTRASRAPGSARTRTRPCAPELAALRDEHDLPAAQSSDLAHDLSARRAELFFSAVGRVAPDSMLALKVALGIAELAALGALFGLLRALGSARRPTRHLRVESARCSWRSGARRTSTRWCCPPWSARRGRSSRAAAPSRPGCSRPAHRSSCTRPRCCP